MRNKLLFPFSKITKYGFCNTSKSGKLSKILCASRLTDATAALGLSIFSTDWFSDNGGNDTPNNLSNTSKLSGLLRTGDSSSFTTSSDVFHVWGWTKI